MRPWGYKNLATKTDLANLGVELRGEIARLDSEIAGPDATPTAKTEGPVTSAADALDRFETNLIARLEQLGNNLERQMAANLRTTLISMFGMILAMGGFIVGFA